MSVNPSQLQAILTAAIPARLPLLITGMPGIGKTDTVESVTASLSNDLILEHPAVGDPQTLKVSHGVIKVQRKQLSCRSGTLPVH